MFLLYESIKPKKEKDVQQAEMDGEFFTVGNFWSSVATKK